MYLAAHVFERVCHEMHPFCILSSMGWIRELGLTQLVTHELLCVLLRKQNGGGVRRSVTDQTGPKPTVDEMERQPSDWKG